MNTFDNAESPPPPASDAGGPGGSSNALAIACLILGILSIPAGLFLIGGLLGLIGLILGIVHLSRRPESTAMAWVGSGLSVLGIAVSVLVVISVGFAIRNMSGGSAEFQKWEGVLAPDFTVTTLDGETIALSDLQGQRVALNFWATWCPPCREEIPSLVQLAEENPPNELLILGVSNEDEATLEPFVEDQGMNYPVASVKDAELPSPFSDVSAIPTTFFIDRNGVIQHVEIGYRSYEDLKANALGPDYEGEPRSEPAPEQTQVNQEIADADGG